MTSALPTDTTYHAVSFVPTFTGRAFYPLAPRVEDLSIIDIAHHLSNQCRYSGAPITTYNTAQHSCILADYAEKEKKATPGECLEILLHDGAEAYLVDVPRPIKQYLPDYRKWDYNITMCIREWLGMKDKPIPSWQDEIDSRIIADERAQIMFDQALDWEHAAEPLGVTIEPWGSRFSEQQFLMRYATYSSRHYNSIQYLRSGWGIPTHSVYTPDFRTRGSDIAQYGEQTDPNTVTDLLEVDIRGGVGRVAIRSPDGMLVRDRSAGKFPRPAWAFIHGKFELTGQGTDHGLGKIL